MRKQIMYTSSLIVSLLLCMLSPPVIHAGPNASAGCALDMDYTTRVYDPGITTTDIESSSEAAANDEIWIAVVAQNVTNLDTYQVEVSFDTNRMAFLGGLEENPSEGIYNLLKNNGGATIGFQAVEHVPGTVNIANALVGADTAEAPEGSGMIALLHFKVLDNNSNNQLTLSNVHYLDSEHTDDPIVTLMHGVMNPSLYDGDVAPLGNRDTKVNVGDALVALRFALCLEIPTKEDKLHGDVAPLDAHGIPNPDGEITVGDALVILRKALGIIAF
jgi:hypothetical protein